MVETQDCHELCHHRQAELKEEIFLYLKEDTIFISLLLIVADEHFLGPYILHSFILILKLL